MPCRCLPVVAGVLLAAATAVAQTVRPGTLEALPAGDPAGTWSLAIENDALVGDDRWYTNGVQITWRSPSADLPAPLEWLNRNLTFLTGEGGRLRWGVALGHQLYTATDRALSDPPRDDRPYAGYLYGAVSLARFNATTLNVLELQVGLVGPSAGGEQVQNGFHRLISDERAEGWRTQLRDEVVFAAIGERRWRIPLLGTAAFGIEAIPAVAASLGTVQTYVGAGLTLRFGQGLDADFGPPRIRPALAGAQSYQPQQDFGWYAFAAADGRAVARDIFLDGNTWQESRSAERIPFVGDLSAGLAVFAGAARLAFTYTWRSREFEQQREAAQFGSVSLSVRF